METETLSLMIDQEQSTYRRKDYLNPLDHYRWNGKAKHPIIVTPSDRKKLVDWCFAIVDTCAFRRETVAIAVDLFDRFLSIPSAAAQVALCDRSELQLLAIASLYLAIKMNERVAFHCNFFVAASCGGYTVNDIESTELQILTGLSWYLHGPTSLQVAMHIFSLVTFDNIVANDTIHFLYDQVHYQTEQAVRDYFLSIQRPSTIAVAAIFNAVELLRDDERIKLFTALVPVVFQFSIADANTISDARDRLLMVMELATDTHSLRVSTSGNVESLRGTMSMSSLHN
ncbi:hypothetical protein HJC23_002887 [Cyclotella cryptica]|uniref:Cyclin N-terminal domain-containing protein n=1 Tax=Cyclotella cryptica TaxID=29204 RepID=A0ABD3NXC2_9STRA|eukprot:CCRYP_019978-RA/>CCRYP_019978-RA protein AED:0.16 eAED:0.16 QI:0/-1/0/1/-1/1/1/0/284